MVLIFGKLAIQEKTFNKSRDLQRYLLWDSIAVE